MSHKRGLFGLWPSLWLSVLLMLSFSARALGPLEILLDGRPMGSLESALKKAEFGSHIELGPGVYRAAGVLNADMVTIEGYGKATLAERAAQGKAALVIRGNLTTVRGIECRDIHVPDGNGACIRLEGRDLLMESVHFHDSQQGLLTGGKPGLVMIRDSRFERLGHRGSAHGIYVGGGELVIVNSQVLAARDEGHEIKSRARRTEIRDSVVASLDSQDSRLIDVSNGGELIIENSLLQQGRNTANSDMIGYGLEGMKHRDNTIRIRGNHLLVDSDKVRLLHTREPVATDMTLNVLVGLTDGTVDETGNLVVASRQEAGLPPYPDLPVTDCRGSGCNDASRP